MKISCYRNELVLHIDEAQRVNFLIAELFIDVGYDIKLCEINGKSTVTNLERWGGFEKTKEAVARSIPFYYYLVTAREQAGKSL
jgi:hypothetical protein